MGSVWANLRIFMKTVSSTQTSRQLLALHLKPHSLSYVQGPDASAAGCNIVKWCAIGHQERLKCDEWSINSKGKIECESAETTEDCIAKIMVCRSYFHRAVPLPLLPTCPKYSWE